MTAFSDLECRLPSRSSQRGFQPSCKLPSIIFVETRNAEISDQPDQKAVHAIVRAHCWAAALEDGKYVSVEALAESAKLHPKVVRGELRLAFLSPNIVESILNGEHSLTLRNMREVGALSWRGQQAELYKD